MRKVFKYALPKPSNSIQLPKGARVMCVDCQEGKPVLWASVDPDAETEMRRFDVMGTGWELNDLHLYVGTCFLRTTSELYPNGFVWHIFEQVEA